MNSLPTSTIRRMILIALAAVTGCAASSAFAAPNEAMAHALWEKSVRQNPAPASGCFHTTYPSVMWVRDQCHATPYHYTPGPRIAAAKQRDIVGDGHDYALAVNGLISQVVGSFPLVRGVQWEQSVGVPAFGGGGILGPNEYTLQINTNFAPATAACNGGAQGCFVWQQFIYSPDYAVQGSAAVFMQYWLINYQNACPDGFWSDGGADCYTNSDYVSAPDIPGTALQGETLTGSAVANGNDTVTFTYNNTAYSLSEPDSVLYIGTVWNQAEFNVVGNAGGSMAQFNPGSFMQVKLVVTDGSTAVPTCLKQAGTTGETNNLNLLMCNAWGGATPRIQFTQLN
ncbi:MAG: hypothetical protein JSR34_06615 [Proteobacteria bacterium]|nr:hypothetical protein [Pseudomonadota bacterium]